MRKDKCIVFFGPESPSATRPSLAPQFRFLVDDLASVLPALQQGVATKVLRQPDGATAGLAAMLERLQSRERAFAEHAKQQQQQQQQQQNKWPEVLLLLCEGHAGVDGNLLMAEQIAQGSMNLHEVLQYSEASARAVQGMWPQPALYVHVRCVYGGNKVADQAARRACDDTAMVLPQHLLLTLDNPGDVQDVLLPRLREIAGL